jgi:hypothetical protein
VRECACQMMTVVSECEYELSGNAVKESCKQTE